MDFVLCRKDLNAEAIRSAVVNLLPLPKERECKDASSHKANARVVSLFPIKTALRQHARKRPGKKCSALLLGQAIPKAFEYPRTQIKIKIKIAFCLLLPSHIILSTSFFKSKDTIKVCVKIKKQTKQP